MILVHKLLNFYFYRVTRNFFTWASRFRALGSFRKCSLTGSNISLIAVDIAGFKSAGCKFPAAKSFSSYIKHTSYIVKQKYVSYFMLYVLYFIFTINLTCSYEL